MSYVWLLFDFLTASSWVPCRTGTDDAPPGFERQQQQYGGERGGRGGRGARRGGARCRGDNGYAGIARSGGDAGYSQQLAGQGGESEWPAMPGYVLGSKPSREPYCPTLDQIQSVA